MRLKQIKILNFGKLSNLTFNLPSDQLTVFFGKNEAGKSTTVSFIKQILFGFKVGNKQDPFFGDYAPLSKAMPMGGSLEFDDQGDQFLLQRIYTGKGAKIGDLTVLKNGEPVETSEFFDRIQNIGADFYIDSFVFNQDMLASISNLSQDKLLERIYYLGAANSSQLLQIRNDFAKSANEKFKKTGTKPPVNQQLIELEQKQSQLSDLQNQQAAYLAKYQELAKLEQQLQLQQEQQASLLAQEQKLSTLTQQQANYQRLLQLTNNQVPVEFDRNLYQAIINLDQRIKTLKQSIDQQNRELAAQEQLIAKLDQKQALALLDQKTTILSQNAQMQTNANLLDQSQAEKAELIKQYPGLEQFAKLSADQITELKAAQAALQRPKASNHVLSYSLLALAILLLILGAFLQNTALLLVSVLLLAAVAVFNQKLTLPQKSADNFDDVFAKAGIDQNASIDVLAQQAIRLRTLEASISQLTEANSQIFAKQAQLLKQVQALINYPDQTDLLTALGMLETQVASQTQERQKYDLIKQRILQSQTELNDLQGEYNHSLTAAKVDSLAALEAKQQAFARFKQAETEIAILRNELRDWLPALDQYAQDQAGFQAKVRANQEQLKAKSETIAQLQKASAELKVEISALESSDQLLTAEQDIADLETKLKASSLDYLSDLLASDMITRALDIASNDRYPKIINAANKYFELLTAGHYRKIEFDRKFRVINESGKALEIKYLSRATSEQLYFALKLAFTTQTQDKINLPILIDDSFVNFDDERVNLIVELLDQLSQKNQVLIFTAQQKLVEQINQPTLTFERD